MDVLYTVYLFNISELLPEILISISSCFTKAIRNNKEQFAKEIKDSQVIVDMIILKSFIFYSDEIKKDEKLINAYEDILLALTEILLFRFGSGSASRKHGGLCCSAYYSREF